MKLTRGLHNISTQPKPSAVTIGNFDGVHKGHQEIIKHLTDKANQLSLHSVLVSFSPTPEQFFGRNHALLSNFREKHQLLSQTNLDENLLIRFNQSFSKLSAEAFVEKILVQSLNVRYCLIGDDFRFGKNRQGDYALLKKLSDKHNFIVENVNSIKSGEVRISSSSIRSTLANGDFKKACHFLGREYFIAGRIVHGDKKGRTIGFPTINIPIKRKISPVQGVFAVIASVKNAQYFGVCNVGKRPTVGGDKTRLEVFLFDFNQDVYGETAKIVFKYRIRDEKKFDSFDMLKNQINEDVLKAKNYFSLEAAK